MTGPHPPLLGEPLAVELANTTYLVRGAEHDGLEDERALATWLRAVRARLELPVDDAVLGAVDAEDLEEARHLRAALRSIWTATAAGSPPSPQAVADVNLASRAAPRWRELTDGGVVVRSTAAPVRAVLGLIADEAIDLLTGLAPVQGCAAPDCILFFLKDHPRRTSCSPRCANRARSARHYARRHARESRGARR